jgi:threonylcarbamoyladenosine tRNA methylthiotransferase CDKAL1
MRVFTKSFGCSANLADGEVLAGCLAAAGHELVNSASGADLIVYNTCAVKGPTENRMIEILRRVPVGKKLVVAGCLPLINFERLGKEVRFDAAVGPAVGDAIVEVAERVLSGEKAIALKEAMRNRPGLDLPRVQLSSVISIIPINYGCLGSCAYCCVVFARGHLRSYTIHEIVDRVRKDLSRGLREFWITSQDVACYGRDQGTSLVELLEALAAIGGEFMVRVGMMTPNVAMTILEDLIEQYRGEHVFKFIHLPVQSGDDQILKRMRRSYSVDDFTRMVQAFRAKFPEMTLSTDVICGFPGENEEAFKKSLALVREVRPDVVNVSKFFARPRTQAAAMEKDFVPLAEIRRRSRLMAEVVSEVAFERNRRWLGWKGEILVDEVGKVRGSWVGRNFAYKPIVVKSADNLLGKTLGVEVTAAFRTHLEARAAQ